MAKVQTGNRRKTILLALSGCLAAAIFWMKAPLTARADRSQTVSVTVSGSLEERQEKQIIDRINEIRREACVQGVTDPRDGDALTEEDYVPVQWSAAMERIAVTRAAEATVLQDHIRPDGKSCFTVEAEVTAGQQTEAGGEPLEVSYMIAADLETLAWGYGNILSSVEGWYSEKESYVSSDGGETGHYIALISPDILYFGAADFTAYGQRDACAGEFSRSADAGGMVTDSAGNVQMKQGSAQIEVEIDVSLESLESICSHAVWETADRIAYKAAPAGLLALWR